MKKEDLARFVSDKAGITQKTAGETVNAVLEGISSALEKGDSLSLIGFGSFKVKGKILAWHSEETEDQFCIRFR